MDGLPLLILHIVRRINGQRSLAGCFHILKGKKSGQAIQDAALFQLSSFYGLLPQLERKDFDDCISQLILDGKLVRVDEKSGQFMQNEQFMEKGLQSKLGQHPASQTVDQLSAIYVVSDTMLAQLEAQLQTYQFYERTHGSFHIAIDELTRFWSCFQLLSQVISYHLHNERVYHPCVLDLCIQQSVKQIWSVQRNKDFLCGQWKKDVEQFMEQLNDAVLCDLLLNRLSGSSVRALTFAQLSRRYDIPEAIIRLYFTHVLHRLYVWGLDHSDSSFRPLINKKSALSLTQSAQNTYDLLNKQLSIEQIMNIRRLKRSTIEDHIVEIAIQDPTFNFDLFLSEEELTLIVQTAERLQSKKLSHIKQHVPPTITYLQVRLALVRGVQYDTVYSL